MKDELTIECNGIEVSPGDFTCDKRGEIAWTIAFACNIKCKDKVALLEMLYGFADDIMEG